MTTKDQAMIPINLYDCKPNCDMEKAVLKGRATWCCAKCGRDFSLEYLFWAEAAHPEWFKEPKP